MIGRDKATIRSQAAEISSCNGMIFGQQNTIRSQKQINKGLRSKIEELELELGSLAKIGHQDLESDAFLVKQAAGRASLPFESKLDPGKSEVFQSNIAYFGLYHTSRFSTHCLTLHDTMYQPQPRSPMRVHNSRVTAYAPRIFPKIVN